ncbi:hypothetical protein F9B85_02305 [Heliorestis acidaminivorans]|uniref:Cell division protein FtsL n=1 Tax=Heliorestis acidaminivorans TaxID=553427 RepID=A0A6I0FAK9_9FIRM|nr:cell division protein FtsL [Heliorestis acidaminivorans]KAB2954528.1 hypothetical protein F9B85_02305 [Heliorestis acidaminivorans]
MKQATAQVLKPIEHYDTAGSKQEEQTVIVKKRRSRKNQRNLVAATLVLMGCGLMVVAQYAAVAHMGKEVQDIRQELTVERNAVDYLQVEINRLQSLDRIENIAMVQLGMQAPTGAQIVSVHNSGVSSKTVAAVAEAKEVKEDEVALTAKQEPPVGTNPLLAALTRFFSKLSNITLLAQS